MTLPERPVSQNEWPIASTFPGDLNELITSNEPTGVVTLKQVIALALMCNPKLQVYSWEIRAAEARQLQAGLRPNPEMGIDIENFGGDGAMSGTDSAETTIQIGQLIELSSKRTKRRNLAAIEKDLAKWDYESKRLDVCAEAAKAIVMVLPAQENLAMQEEAVNISEQMSAVVAARVEVGKGPSLKETKAEVALTKAHIGQNLAVEKLKSTRQQLVATWGQTVAQFEKAAGAFESMSAPPLQVKVIEMLTQNPDIARLGDEIEARLSVLDLEKAKSVPDPALFGGIRHFAEYDSDALVLSIGIPIPLFDRNQENIREASHELAEARANSKAVYAAIQSLLIKVYQDLVSAHKELTVLESQVLPGAGSAFDTAREGYREVKFDYLTVLDAQWTLFDTQTQYIEALLFYHMAKIDLERLIAQSLSSLK